MSLNNLQSLYNQHLHFIGKKLLINLINMVSGLLDEKHAKSLF
jgi:hypothetical protein